MEFKNIRPITGSGRKLYIETYGCQMNVGDSEIVVSIMQADGYIYTEDATEADVLLINTCSIRDNAEQRIWGRLKEFKQHKRRRKGVLVGVIGCMAERLREQLMEREQIVDIVAGPDSYRDLPRLVRIASEGGRSVNVQLSQEETYAEISPVRLDKNGVSAFIAIMRGCNNMCSYCVVPYTRGGERSRNPQTILREVREVFEAGYREVTLLGQNVNSYRWDAKAAKTANATDGDIESSDNESRPTDNIQEFDFPSLLEAVAQISPLLRVRFATSHPKDISDQLIATIATNRNLCHSIHLPAQSGSTRMLELMNRKYTREWYLERITAIKREIPDCGITTDLIAGFCGETEQDHQQTLSLMEHVGYDFAYMFKYSERPNTKAQRTMPDDISEDVKTARLTEIISLQNRLSLESNRKDIGKTFEVLVENVSKRSDEQLSGRTSQNKVVIFDRDTYKIGDYVNVKIDDCTSATLMGTATGISIC